MTAPERIWATGNGDTGSWNASPATFRGPIETQFVRADLLDEAVKALENPVRSDDGLYDYEQSVIDALLAKLRSKP